MADVVVPPSDDERERCRQICGEVAKKCGIDVRIVLFSTTGETGCAAVIEHSTTDLSFLMLEKLSDQLGSRSINLSCDLGTSSDHTHEPCVTVRWPSWEMMRKNLFRS